MENNVLLKNGVPEESSWLEVLLAVYIIFPSLLISNRFLWWTNSKGNHSLSLIFFCEFIVFVLPTIASLTVFSDHLVSLAVALTVLAGTIVSLQHSYQNVDEKVPQLSTENITITLVRSVLGLMTAIAILAVDFKCFPARFMKREEYGFSLMDIGASGFLLINALVDMRPSKTFKTFKWLQSVLILSLLGGFRLLSLKATDYHQNPSEYGKHSNFFFVLALTKLCCLPICRLLNTLPCLVMSIFLTIGQHVNTVTHTDWVFDVSERYEFIEANKETFIAMSGHFALYFYGAVLGKIIFNGDRLKTLSTYSLGMVLSASMLILCGASGLQPSRRVVNLAFIFWMLLVIFICLQLSSRLESYFKTVDSIQTAPLIMQAINKYQLIFFFVANIITGLINLSIDTDAVPAPYDTLIVVTYTAALCGMVTLMYANRGEFKNKRA